MIKLEDIKGRSAINLLNNYKGKNPYIKKLRKKYKKKGKIDLTKNQTKYIIDNHDSEPMLINKVINITEYLGEELKNKNDLSFIPERILVEFMLADTEKAFHVYGKLKRNQNKSKMYWLPKTQVIDDPYFDEVDIDIDFDKYVKLDKLGRKPYEHQVSGIKFLLGRKGCILADDMGLGKAEYINNKVFTPQGRKKIGELIPGNKVIGSNGKPTTVEAVYPQGNKELYRVEFNDGYSILVCKEHLFTVFNRFNKKSTLSVEEISKKGLITPEGYYKWEVPTTDIIKYDVNNEIKDPYNFGYSINSLIYSGIPDNYKYSTVENRISILEGIMDNGGKYVPQHETPYVEYNHTSEKVIDDIIEIVHSLGGLATKSIKNGVYGLRIVKLKNIASFKDSDWGHDLYNKIDFTRYITNIKLDKSGEAVCIKVSAKDSLYVTEHAIVTHNTYQAIIGALESGAEKILIVCPSNVKINWEREINNFDPNTKIISGKKWDPDKFTIINYDILKNFHTLVKKGKKKGKININRDIVNHEFDLVIIDEAHYLKNHKSNRGKIMQEICVKNGVENVWLLTGTPIANRPMDFYNLLKLIKAPIADNWKFYTMRYCDGKTFFKTLKNGRKKQIWLTDGASNLEELSIKIRNNVLRRKKEEVLDMPDKNITANYYKLSKKDVVEYENLWEEYLERRILMKKRGKPDKNLVEIILLRKFIAMKSIPYTIEDTENIISQREKVIIFTTFSDEIDELSNHFGNQCVIHNGKMNDTEKQVSVDRFMNDNNVKVFIGNIKSAGVGITLTSSSYVIFNSFSWVPGDNDQAEDRSYRIGQNNNVTIKYQLFLDTVSIKVWDKLREKRNVINTIMDDKNDKEIEDNIIEEILTNGYEKNG